MTARRSERQPKRKRGRPVEKPMPELIPDSAENVLRAVLASPPKRTWRLPAERWEKAMTDSAVMLGRIVGLLESIDKRLESIDDRLAMTNVENTTDGFSDVVGRLGEVVDAVRRVENAVHASY